jgi:hypothetical protein
MLTGEAAETYFIVFGLTRRDEHANHYTPDDVEKK